MNLSREALVSPGKEVLFLSSSYDPDCHLTMQCIRRKQPSGLLSHTKVMQVAKVAGSPQALEPSVWGGLTGASSLILSNDQPTSIGSFCARERGVEVLLGWTWGLSKG